MSRASSFLTRTCGGSSSHSIQSMTKVKWNNCGNLSNVIAHNAQLFALKPLLLASKQRKLQPPKKCHRTLFATGLSHPRLPLRSQHRSLSFVYISASLFIAIASHGQPEKLIKQTYDFHLHLARNYHPHPSSIWPVQPSGFHVLIYDHVRDVSGEKKKNNRKLKVEKNIILLQIINIMIHGQWYARMHVRMWQRQRGTQFKLMNLMIF